jgi:hypothetical protein
VPSFFTICSGIHVILKLVLQNFKVSMLVLVTGGICELCRYYSLRWHKNLPSFMTIVSGVQVILTSNISEALCMVFLMEGVTKNALDMVTKDRFRISEIVRVTHAHTRTARCSYKIAFIFSPE